jgi:hypothetical protein
MKCAYSKVVTSDIATSASLDALKEAWCEFVQLCCRRIVFISYFSSSSTSGRNSAEDTAGLLRFSDLCHKQMCTLVLMSFKSLI